MNRVSGALAGLSLLGLVGERNPWKISGGAEQVCPTPRPWILQ